MKRCITLQIVVGLFYMTFCQEIDQECDNGKGECKPISKCPPIANNFLEIFESLTYCKSTQNLICCPKKVIPKNKVFIEDRSKVAVQKCIEYKELIYSKCDPQKLIIGGTKAEPREFPFMALVGEIRPNKTDKWACGGMLVSRKWVLSAAHCFYAPFFRPNRVRLGELDYASEQDDAQPQDFDIKQRLVHPQYNFLKHYNDVVLIELDREAELNRYVVPACLPLTNGTEYDQFVVAGWGATKNDTKSTHLLKAHVERFEDEECKGLVDSDKLDHGVHERTQLCAGSRIDNQDACYGDSGGPLFIEHPIYNCMYLIVGITSFGQGCGFTNTPGVYVRINRYVSWIENVVWDAAGSI